MAKKMLYESYHHFPKIAEESGFAFNLHRPHSRIDWNKIKSIDIENVIRDRRFIVVEQNLSNIMNCALDSEFDVRILDEGVLKIFRLAQLAVEYQQFCRHYLDRSVHILRDEITALAQELDATKKELHEKQEELTKYKRKTKQQYKPRYLYGNDNIASVLLKTLTNRTDLFSSTSNGRDAMPYNKCTYCDKVFLNQIYLQSHLTRRHPNAVAIPQKDVRENNHHNSGNEEGNDFRNDHSKENEKLTSEIEELKTRLKEMENIIAELKTAKTPELPMNSKNFSNETDPDDNDRTIIPKPINIKDAEDLTSHEDYLVNKIEELQKTEFDKYNREINSLRSQIIETLNSFQKTENPDKQLIEQLHATIKQQSNEIIALKEDIRNSKLRCNDEENERKKEMESQMKMWARREENQAKQYETLLKKLNVMSKEAQEARVLAEAERLRGEQLQTLLQETISETHDRDVKTMKKVTSSNSENNQNPVRTKHNHPNPNRETLENLQHKARELLSGALTSSSEAASESDNDDNTDVVETKTKSNNNKLEVKSPDSTKSSINKQVLKNSDKKIGLLMSEKDVISLPNHRRKLKEKSKSHSNVAMKDEKPLRAPGSPVKLFRAKITEEVNNRIVGFGADPFKRKITTTEWRRHRMQLQRQWELKSKKNPSYQKIRNSLVAYLDTSLQNEIFSTQTEKTETSISPTKRFKPFSFSSVLCNVKSKALSLVKPKDVNETPKNKSWIKEISEKSATEIESPISSPEISPGPVATQRNKRDTPKHYLDSKDQAKAEKQTAIKEKDSDEGSESNKYYNSAIAVKDAKDNVLSLIKSPVRRPHSASDIVSRKQKSEIYENGKFERAKSATNLTEFNGVNLDRKTFKSNKSQNVSSESDEEQLDKTPELNTKVQTKGVLKNASSTSSLNKKKVLFDMEAIQMKSVSASPSQSTADKIDDNFELGLVNLDTEEWDISSIENEPLKNDTKTQVIRCPTMRVSKLTKTIESQLAHRKQTDSSAIVGGVDVLGGTLKHSTNYGGSNTSLGSSILDESDSPPATRNNAFLQPSLSQREVF